MTVETANSDAETLSDENKWHGHIDVILHHIEQRLTGIEVKLATAEAFIEQHQGALNRGLGMLDTGAKMRGFLGKHGKGSHDGQAST